MFGKSKKVKNLRPMTEVCESEVMRNAAGVLLANIEYSSVDKKIQNVVVTSAAPNEGKSTVAMSLAMAIGAKGKKCLLIEGDLRRRSLCAALHAHPKHGMQTYGCDERYREDHFQKRIVIKCQIGINCVSDMQKHEQNGKKPKRCIHLFHFHLSSSPDRFYPA